jgi:hypothetical protein
MAILSVFIGLSDTAVDAYRPRYIISHGETRRQSAPSRAGPGHNSGRTGLANKDGADRSAFWPRDIVARLVADGLQQKYPASAFIVENKPGAGDNLGTDLVAKATPDGSTIGVSIGGPLAINTLLFAPLPYDPRKDLTLITLSVTQPSVLAVNSAVGADSTRALIDVIKRDPGKYAFGSIGAGSLSHLAMEAIALKSGARLVHVPYPVATGHHG